MKKTQSKSLFESILESAKQNKTSENRTKDALNWYRKKMQSLLGDKNVIPTNYFEKKNYPNLPIKGNIVTFKYTPKYEDKLRYYDIFPLVLILKVIPGGFIGLNFHYLKPIHRAYFMSILYRYVNSDSNRSLYININYNILKKSFILRYYRPCIKRYLNANINTIFYTLLPDEWNFALFLPTEDFIKEDAQNIWKESEEIFNSL